MEQVKEKMEQFNSEMSKIPFLDKITSATNLPAGAIVAAMVALSVVIVALDFGISGFLVQVVGVMYPVFKSVQALESKRTDDDHQWLTYWFIFSLFQLAEHTLQILVNYIPFYQLIKILFLIWLQNPVTRGAEKIYEERLAHLIKKYKTEIEQLAEAIDSALSGSKGEDKASDPKADSKPKEDVSSRAESYKVDKAPAASEEVEELDKPAADKKDD
eukprot:CAMPEP_0170481626 /NCGR_PEP_ID=MMETSP0208-20121228/1998_1 /TAXON_ID=197538 /ORGANISM="Strombidium inclinatum, Strain S3" /LENGTH=215 /DNA_ID=CAMNT_0010754367 /DNA_START=17 /DNA_END=664 /DNA_ORIENTATION=+